MVRTILLFTVLSNFEEIQDKQRPTSGWAFLPYTRQCSFEGDPKWL